MVTERFVVVPRFLVQARQREQLVRRSRRGVAARLEIGEDLFGGADVSGALIVVEHASHRRQVGRARGDVGTGPIEKRAEAVGALEQLEVALDVAGVPERPERPVVHRERVGGRPAARGQVGAPFQHPRVIGGERLLIAAQQRLGVGRPVAVDEEAKQTVVGSGLLRISRDPCAALRFGECVGQLLRVDEREQPFEDSPRSPLGRRQQPIGRRILCTRRGGQRVPFPLRQQTTVIEVGERELSGGGVGRGARVRTPIGLGGLGIELLFGHARAQRQQFPIGGGAGGRPQRVVGVGRRAAHLDGTGRRRHGAEDRIVPAPGGLYVAHPLRQLRAQAEGRRRNRRGGKAGRDAPTHAWSLKPDHGARDVTGGHRRLSPGWPRCARCPRQSRE